MKRTMLLLCCTCLIGHGSIASTEAAAENDEAPGIKVGEMVPAFTLKDQNGKEYVLTDMLGKGNVALVFHRSADW